MSVVRTPYSRTHILVGAECMSFCLGLFLHVCYFLFVHLCVTEQMSRSSVSSNLGFSEGGLVHSSHVSPLYYSIDNISLSSLSLYTPEYSAFVLFFLSSFYRLFSRLASITICTKISLRNQNRLSIILITVAQLK